VHHHLDSEKGFLDAAACAALVGDRRKPTSTCAARAVHAGRQAGLDQRGVDPDRLFIERFEVPEEPAVREESERKRW
jgi:ferredoxin-NADP reductase